MPGTCAPGAVHRVHPRRHHLAQGAAAGTAASPQCLAYCWEQKGVTLPGQPNREEVGVKEEAWVPTGMGVRMRVGELSKDTVDKGVVGAHIIQL